MITDLKQVTDEVRMWSAKEVKSTRTYNTMKSILNKTKYVVRMFKGSNKKKKWIKLHCECQNETKGC